MNRLYPSLLISAIFLTGCNSGDADSGSGGGELVTPHNTCRALFNEDKGNPVNTTLVFLRDVDILDETTAGEAKALSERLGDVAATAEEELAAPTRELRRPLNDFVEAWDTNGTWHLDEAAVKRPAQELIDICGELFPGETETASPEAVEPTAGKSATPSAIPSTPNAEPQSQPATFEFDCHTPPSGRVKLSTVQEVWANRMAECYVTMQGEILPAATATAVELAFPEDPSPEKATQLYNACAETSETFLAGFERARLLEGALMLCPDHPQRKAIEKAIASGYQGEATRTKSGDFVGAGSYLVGTEIHPGTWQSFGTQVEDCYWEISDAQGNIIENNFISIAPRFEIQIPATAAGFTATNCSFQRISD
ncbi:hypothetical protein [Arthrobacter sp. zg-Y179]|uniref:hypothetical protein n=1 Tax=Arthrobacter sp. zg-Y179 TaxID=2894188 RepID=UPI001E5181FB|nr:hypothetical protein [Arthrobacter sp. zg-Y179]MCC9173241.1 hypothetical protein [Arthrobacter sp. zg-Y179]